MINDRPARVVAVIVEAADVHEVIEAKLPLREFAHGGDLFRVGELHLISPRNSAGSEMSLPNSAFNF
jgi:hypothetical protein